MVTTVPLLLESLKFSFCKYEFNSRQHNVWSCTNLSVNTVAYIYITLNTLVSPSIVLPTSYIYHNYNNTIQTRDVVHINHTLHDNQREGL